MRAKIDLEEGWHVSSSNHRVTGVEGLDVDLTFALGDTNCEANLLNAAGITTAVNMFGNGIVEWGNYSAGFPGNTNTEAFECVRRTRAIMKRSIQQACIPFIDKPFIKANMDAIRNTVNQYLNGLILKLNFQELKKEIDATLHSESQQKEAKAIYFNPKGWGVKNILYFK